MRIFFIGNVSFSRKMLETLIEIDPVDIIGVATKSKSSFNADHTDLSDIAVKNNIPFKYVKDINAAHILDWIKELNPDVIYCMGWSSLIKTELLNLTRLGVVGYHPAKLPQNRGRHPIIWALSLGLDETASTFFKMNEGSDSGEILSQEIVQIHFKDDANTLYQKLTNVAKEQVLELTLNLVTNSVIFSKQDDSKANYWRKRGPNDGLIDFRMSSVSIYNLTRALTKPYVGAHILYKNDEIKIWNTKVGPISAKNIEPGKVLSISENNEILVKSGDGSVWLLDHEFSNLPTVKEYIL